MSFHFIRSPGDPDRIRSAIEASTYSQREIARAVNVSENTVSQWKTGFRKPSALNLCKLARVLGVHVRELLDNSQPEARLVIAGYVELVRP
jgi:transcriptional regulator with XRE-family HTH domain